MHPIALSYTSVAAQEWYIAHVKNEKDFIRLEVLFDVPETRFRIVNKDDYLAINWASWNISRKSKTTMMISRSNYQDESEPRYRRRKTILQQYQPWQKIIIQLDYWNQQHQSHSATCLMGSLWHILFFCPRTWNVLHRREWYASTQTVLQLRWYYSDGCWRYIGLYLFHYMVALSGHLQGKLSLT